MDRLHEELLWLEGKNVSGQQAVVEDNDEWETVGPKNRSALTRTHLSMKSQLTDIFGGQLCSIVKAKGTGSLTFIFQCDCNNSNLLEHVAGCYDQDKGFMGTNYLMLPNSSRCSCVVGPPYCMN